MRNRTHETTLAAMALTLALGLTGCGESEPAPDSMDDAAVVDVQEPESPDVADAAAEIETAVEDASEDLTQQWESFDVTDAEKFEALARELELEVVALETATPHRGSGSDALIVPVFPRGDIRIEDLESFRVDVGLEFEPGGKLFFKQGSKTLWEGEFDPEEITTIQAIPEEVLSVIETGDRVTWGYEPERGKKVTTKFKIVEPKLEKRWERIAKRVDPDNEMLLKQFRAQLYLDKGLAMAAYREASDVGQQTQSAAAWNIAQAALRKLDLDDTEIWNETSIALQNAKRKPESGLGGVGGSRR